MKYRLNLFLVRQNVVLFSIIPFIAFFFIFIHPFYIFDTDDWINMSCMRPLYPSLLSYNPSKIFPEISFPIISILSINILYPFTNDYVLCVSLGVTLFYVFFVLSYFWIVGKFINKFTTIFNFYETTKNSITLSNVFLLLFVFFHFSATRENSFLLNSSNVTCLFHYAIPTLINLSLVMLFVYKDVFSIKLWFDKNIINKSILIVIIYLSIFSNLFVNFVLVSYSIMVISNNFFTSICLQKNFDLYAFVKNNSLNLLIITLFIISAVFEINGQRAITVGSGNIINFDSFIASLREFIFSTVLSFGVNSLIFLILIIFMANALSFVIVFCSSNTKTRFLLKNYWNIEKKLFFILIIVILWQILVTMKTGLSYQHNVSLILSWYSILLLIFILSISYLISIFNLFKFILPIFVFYIFYNQIISIDPFISANFVPFAYTEDVKSFTNDVVTQVIQADRAGVARYELHVPKFEVWTNDNFPIALYGANSISSALYRQGLILNQLELIIVPDYSVNIKYRIPMNFSEHFKQF